MNEPRRHHYIPQFYLRRFADQQGHVRMIRRSTGKSVKSSVTNAAVTTGFYDVEAETGLPRDSFEAALGDVEGEAAQALKRVDERTWPPSDYDRATVAMFMGLQMVRTPEHRFMFEEMADVQLKSNLTVITRDEVADILVKAGEDPSEENIDEHLAAIRQTDEYTLTMGQGFMWGVLLGDVAPRLAMVLSEGYDWHLMESDRRVLATSDHPVLPWKSQPERFLGMGVVNADAIVLPIDSKKLLLLTSERHGVSLRFPLSRAQARETNGYLVAHSNEWVFHDPRITAPFNPDELTPQTRPTFVINNEEVREPGEAWNVISDLFYKTQYAYFGHPTEEE